jgi:ketosteroid isomerase-like protein
VSQQNVEIVRRGFEVLNRDGLQGALRFIDEVCDPEAEVRAIGRLPDVKRVRGPDAVKAWFGELFGTFEIRLEADEFIDAGDSVVVVFRQIARGRTSGAELTDRFGFVYGFRNGKITYLDGYHTKREALEAVGLREEAVSQDNVEVVRHLLDAFNRGDVDSVIAAFHESCELHEPPQMPDSPAQGFRGHDGIREWMANLRGVAGVRFEPRSFTTSGDVILSEWVSRGHGQASGVPMEWTTFAVLQMRDGKIARAQGFLSRAEALESVGLRE